MNDAYTKSSGFQIGVRKTFPLSNKQIWDFILSKPGIEIWLGIPEEFPLLPDTPFKTVAGIEGMVTVLKPLSHIRLTWKKPEWEKKSIVQIRLISTKSGTTISFHQEKLRDADQKAEMKQYWDNVIEKISSHFGK